MEHKIEFVGVDTLSLYRKVYWHMSLRNRLINLAIFAAATLWALTSYFEEGRTSRLVLAILYVFLAVWYQLRPLRTAKKAFESNLKFNDGDVPPTTVCFGDEIVFRDKNNSSVVSYGKIKKIHFVKEGLLMDMEENKVYFSAIDYFTKGSMEELKQFLREKRPDLKIPE